VVENRDFFIPFAFDAPVRAVPFGMEKLEWWTYPTVKKTLMIRLAVSTEYRRVPDGQTYAVAIKTDTRLAVCPSDCHTPVFCRNG